MKSLSDMINDAQAKMNQPSGQEDHQEPQPDSEVQAETAVEAPPVEYKHREEERIKPEPTQELGEGIVKLPITALDHFENDPFRIQEGAAMDALVESVREMGILSPLIVRPKASGRYEILSGRHRRIAAGLAGLTECPCIVREDIDDDEAILIVTESNLKQRDNLLPSEKAFAYKMQMEVIKREGKNTNNHYLISYSDAENQDNSTRWNLQDKVANVYRYISLTKLVPDLLALVDDNILAIKAGEQLSDISQEEQEIIHCFFFVDQKGAIPPALASQIRQRAKEVEITERELAKLTGKAEKSSAPRAFSISAKKVEGYFPPGTKKKEAEQTILKALDFYFANKPGEEEMNEEGIK